MSIFTNNSNVLKYFIPSVHNAATSVGDNAHFTIPNTNPKPNFYCLEQKLTAFKILKEFMFTLKDHVNQPILNKNRQFNCTFYIGIYKQNVRFLLIEENRSHFKI